jgi:hypothetical protein
MAFKVNVVSRRNRALIARHLRNLASPGFQK